MNQKKSPALFLALSALTAVIFISYPQPAHSRGGIIQEIKTEGEKTTSNLGVTRSGLSAATETEKTSSENKENQSKGEKAPPAYRGKGNIFHLFYDNHRKGILIKWEKPSSAYIVLSYKIYRGESNEKQEQIAEVPGDQNTYFDPYINPDKIYYYKVVGVFQFDGKQHFHIFPTQKFSPSKTSADNQTNYSEQRLSAAGTPEDITRSCGMVCNVVSAYNPPVPLTLFLLFLLAIPTLISRKKKSEW